MGPPANNQFERAGVNRMPRKSRLRSSKRPMLIVVSALIVASAVVLALTARTHTPPFRHPDGRLVEGSIAEERRVTLGGWDQYVLIRGRDRTAPIL